MPKLEEMRRRRLLTQKDLAEKAKVAKSTVYLIEAGQTRPRLSVIRRISEALEVPAEDIDEFRAVILGKPEGS